MERYMTVLKSFKRMDPSLEKALRENVYPLSLSANQVLQEYSECNNAIYFVEKGLLYRYVQRRNKRDITLFIPEDQFILSLNELEDRLNTSSQAIAALEDTVLWCMPGDVVANMRDKFMDFQIQYSQMLINNIIRMNDAERLLAGTESSDLFDILRQLFPELLNRVPIAYLSNFSGIPERTLTHLLNSKLKLNADVVRHRRQRSEKG